MTNPETETKSKTLQRVEWLASEAKLPIPQNDLGEDQMEWPRDISALNDGDLSRLMGQYAGLIAYAEFVVGQNSVEFTAKKAAYEKTKAKFYMVFRQDERMTEREREAAMENHRELAPMKYEMVQAETVVSYVTSLLKGYTAKYSVLSRELTRRGFRSDRGY